MPTSGTVQPMMPTATVDESSEMTIEPTYSSGGSHTAKMTIVVSDVVTA
jgi:hypothetical protein